MASSAKAEPQARDFVDALRARALLLGDRIAVDRSERAGVVSIAPFCFRQDDGFAVLFRYGAVVLAGLSPVAEDRILADLARDVVSADPIEEEQLRIELVADHDEGLAPSGVLQLRTLDPARVLVLADVLAKSVALARYEREIASVFDTIEPPANTLAVSGRIPSDRRGLLKLIGSALLVQHRVSGRIAFAEKPDILWEHPELERLYARLEDEYEIVERGTLLNGKMDVISAAAQTFTDMMDTARSARLELLVVVLILAELVITVVTLFRS
jgi:uncharacterized Rmd1/YagE family protein